jgi:acetyltransferase-like isoleucine patch superfamily enzyme
MIPGVYSNWLRLWGSRIGRLTYWAPGMVVLDREYLDLGDDVVFGAGVRLNGHVILRNPQGRLVLAVAPIRIGAGAAIGGYSLLTAGTEIAAGESTRAHLLSPPFTIWRNGKRHRGGNDDAEE